MSLTGVSGLAGRRHPRFGPSPEIGPEIAIVSVVSADASISGYEPVPFAIADGNVMFPLGVGDGTVFEQMGLAVMGYATLGSRCDNSAASAWLFVICLRIALNGEIAQMLSL